jgi:hypothetical protein
MRWWRRAMNRRYSWGDTAGAGMIWDGNRRQVCLRSRGDLLCRKEKRITPAFIGRGGIHAIVHLPAEPDPKKDAGQGVFPYERGMHYGISGFLYTLCTGEWYCILPVLSADYPPTIRGPGT